jgi:Cu(I)/Ag(I) efflux system membrane fusion protein
MRLQESIAMTTHPSGRRAWFLWLLGFVFLGAGIIAHFTGLLTPLYHHLGLHATAGANQDSDMEDMPGMPGMKMPKRQGQQAMKSSIPGYSKVTISADRQQRIGVRTGKVKHDDLLMSIRAVGIIEVDQKKLARIHTRVSGWVTKVYVDYVGQDVEKNAKLLDIYSPDLVATQDEYLIALDAKNKSLAQSSLRRLQLWGVPDDELKELAATKKTRDTLALRSPIKGRVLERNVLEGSRVEPANELYRIADLSVVWLQARIYEYELPHVKVGQKAQIKLLSQPETTFKGEVAFIEPVFQEITRTVKVRIPIKNTQELLFKPGMYADVTIDHEMGHGLLVPESALLRTGERDLAFRVLGEGTFEPVEVTLKGRFGDWYQIQPGPLKAGDEVVTSAVFLIDAESRLKSALGGMAGHQHGSSKQNVPPATKEHQHDGGMKGHDHGGHKH